MLTSSRLGLLALALVALGAGIAAWFLRPARVEPFVAEVPALPAATPDEARFFAAEDQGATRGGSYAGIVVDEAGRPVAGADVLLVARDTKAQNVIETLEGEGTDSQLAVPIVGAYRTAARGRTEADGTFVLAAGDAAALALVAYSRGYAPAIQAHVETAPLKPGNDHRLVLARAGFLRGRVLDAATKAPVVGAQVVVYLQHRANQDRPGPDPWTPQNAFARFQTYVVRELGPLVWGMEARRGDSGFNMKTGAQGDFLFGPLMKEVQVEVVITHPDYMWTEMDPEVQFEGDNAQRDPAAKPVTRRRRTVVPPGETVEREYLLEKGKEIRGTVKDSEGRPIEGVVVQAEHVAQYYQHPWYRSRSRDAITDKDGRFRIAGLSFEPYLLRMSHESFDPTAEAPFFNQVKAGSDEVYKVWTAGGWIEATVEGGPEGKPEWAGRAILVPVGRTGARFERRVLVREGRCTVDGVALGTYDLSLASATKVSEIARVEVRAGGPTAASLRMLDGGRVSVEIRDGNGVPIDPASVELDLVRGDAVLRGAAMLIARMGTARGEGLLAGRYVPRARAEGYMPATGAPFEVAAGASVVLPAMVLKRQAYLRITGVNGADGRSVPGNVDVHLTVKEGDDEPRPGRTREAGLLPVSPGRVILSAQSSDGQRFEQSLDVPDGGTIPVEIRLTR